MFPINGFPEWLEKPNITGNIRTTLTKNYSDKYEYQNQTYHPGQ